ncbi:MAG: tRNA glutamyl-Q(34) synthetase GluQRS [Alphaproteobacteria bacterium]|nr:tRNA glutamyl-Q(34) synthetase GluQRS [Alphaproteobacteria bacterium]
MTAKTVTRFAPSPTGYLHLGHAWSALFAEQQSRLAGGTFLLRIEDIDPTRCKPEFTAAIIEDLTWLGLRWDGVVRHQSRHMTDYAAALDTLRRKGVLYPCFCTRREIAEEAAAAGYAPHLIGDDDVGVTYPGTCRHLTVAERAEKEQRNQGQMNWRLDVAAALRLAGELTWQDVAAGVRVARPQDFGDVVLARKDVPTSYHLSVTVDDALQDVTLVTRGTDLFRATDIHRLLQALLDLPVPQYHHHTLLTDATGRRYAKRDQSVTLRALRESGKTPEALRQELPSIP